MTTVARYIGWNYGFLETYRFVLREDHIEQISQGTTHGDVTRLFFDEATCATVHSRPRWSSVAGLVLLTVVLAWVAGWGALNGSDGAWIFALAGLVSFGGLLLTWRSPRQCLVIRAPGQSMLIDHVPGLRASWREKTILDVVQAIERYQAEHEPKEPGEHGHTATGQL